jgi:hypothetical protein
MKPHPLTDPSTAWGQLRSHAHSILTETSFWNASVHLWGAAVLVFFWQEVDPDLGGPMMDYLKGVLIQGDIQPFCQELSGSCHVWSRLLADLPAREAENLSGLFEHPFALAVAKAMTLLVQTQWMLWLGKTGPLLGRNAVRVLQANDWHRGQSLRKFYAYWCLDWAAELELKGGQSTFRLVANCDTTHPLINDPHHPQYQPASAWEAHLGFHEEGFEFFNLCWDWLRFNSRLEHHHAMRVRDRIPGLRLSAQSRIPISEDFTPFFCLELMLARRGEEVAGGGGWWLEPPSSSALPSNLEGTPLHLDVT